MCKIKFSMENLYTVWVIWTSGNIMRLITVNHKKTYTSDSEVVNWLMLLKKLRQLSKFRNLTKIGVPYVVPGRSIKIV